MDLVEFLTARLDDDESAAEACRWRDWVPGSDLHPPSVETAEPQPGWHGERATVAGLQATVGKVEREYEHAAHIARHDPARVLREVAAKRQLLADALKMAEDAADTEFWGLQNNAARIAQLLAAPYADHPDFQPEWRLDA
jgi:uncharacterized protein DUF6221